MEQVISTSKNRKMKYERSGGRTLTTTERESLDLSSKIKGWGSDLDLAVRPGVPNDKAPQLGYESLYPDIEPQVATAKVHKSTEHMRMPPVFGNVCPPKALSGLIRDHAFKFSEGQTRHWLYLVLADRVDMVEVLVSDVLRLDIPNIPKEMGMGAVLKHDKRAILKWAGVGLGVAALGAFVATRARRASLETSASSEVGPNLRS